MNRQILFRGKRKDNGEWVFGDLIRNLIYDGREKEMRIGDIYFEHNGDIHGTAVYKVVPETVGQFTGFTDKNGKKIFEGDIVKEWSSHWKTPLKTEINIYEVVCEYLGSLHLIRKTEYGENSTPLYRRSVVEVIGNIYDNKELLK